MREIELSVDIIQLHKRWADRHLIVWITFAVCLFLGVQILLDYLSISEEMRTSSEILLATIIVTGAVWRAISAAVARIHMLIQSSES